MNEQAINAEMLVLGRESRGLTQVELAHRVGVSQGRMSKAEAGLLPVSDELLESIADRLRYPPSFFRQPGPAFRFGTGELFHYRRRQSLSQRALARIQASVNVRRLNVNALLRSVDVPIAQIPQLDPDEYEDDIEQIAQLIRAAWHVRRGPVDNMSHLIEEMGIFVIEMDFHTKMIDATSVWAPPSPPLIFVNRVLPTDRRRLTLAHEVGHLVMHREPRLDGEAEANRFAAEFLMPAADILPDLDDLTFGKLATLKQYWKVSMAAIVMRAKNLECISERKARDLFTRLSAAGFRTREPVELPHEAPHLLTSIIDTHLTQLGYDDEDLAGLVRLYDDETQDLKRTGLPLRVVQ